ncbi:PREDICTED: 1-phosphatidylinositol 4,5-bisphosphate phosphodiesterase eta-2 [Condylura cristata]|uniref:1-phosphatidylinositol 4,5-bisphosphate phosphodiesterase eta-2 n=1 Tax=Condylura cristata TaxID=143302 RepID=UPI000643CE5A|nr:PREDICTED: 1-phosphatidylinositol 4,5-bisphosphate phosphodiesterase eta-2 [Condylura cristata]
MRFMQFRAKDSYSLALSKLEKALPCSAALTPAVKCVDPGPPRLATCCSGDGAVGRHRAAGTAGSVLLSVQPRPLEARCRVLDPVRAGELGVHPAPRDRVLTAAPPPVSIDSIQEVSEGRQSEVFQRYPEGSFDPNCCFSIYHGGHRESLALVSSSGDEARTWVTGLRYLMAGISDEDSLARRQRTRDQWLKQTFDEADKNGDGSLSMGEVLQLLHKLNVNLPRQRVKQMFKEADTDDRQGALGFEEFCTFYKVMSTRRDLYLLLLTYSDHKDHLEAADLQRFLEAEQKEVRPAHAERQICCCHHPLAGGFTDYMRSPAGDIANPEHHGVHQDMTRPLSHYFITSSHNTYLAGDQLLSQSRVDMYARVLQAGCRCVEVDCWDGPDGEPIVHHGYTLTSKILFRDVIETINKYAFIKNEYPVILSIENHCSVAQQKKMAQYLTDILGDKLDLSSVSGEDATMLPSPQMLKGKILVKGKKLPASISEDAEAGEVSDEDSADEIEEDYKLLEGGASANQKRVENIAKKKLDSLIKESKIRDCEDPNDLTVSARPGAGRLRRQAEGKRADDDAECGQEQAASRRRMGGFSRRKRKSSKLKTAASEEEGDGAPDSLGGQSRGSAPRPGDSGVDGPDRALPAVALNYQSEGRVLQLNRAKFSANGGCGYVLKPDCMCRGIFNPNSEDPLPGQLKKQLVLRIISGQQLPKPRASMLGDRGEIIDPFVEVEIIGLPVDCSKEQTRVVDDNGFNPMWEETLVFTLHMPEIALVRFLVWDHDPIGRDFIGQRTLLGSERGVQVTAGPHVPGPPGPAPRRAGDSGLSAPLARRHPPSSARRSGPALCSLETVAEEPALGAGTPLVAAPRGSSHGPRCHSGPDAKAACPQEALGASGPCPTACPDPVGWGWERPELGSPRDSVSSASSGTVVDLFPPGLGHEGLTGAPAGRLPPRPGLAWAPRLDPPTVTKSESNPNLLAAGQPSAGRGEPRPCPRNPRPPWGRLPLVGLWECPVGAKSKSLGDLTVEDFTPGAGSLGPCLGAPQDALAEQLCWLAGSRQHRDITSASELNALEQASVASPDPSPKRGHGGHGGPAAGREALEEPEDPRQRGPPRRAGWEEGSGDPQPQRQHRPSQRPLGPRAAHAEAEPQAALTSLNGETKIKEKRGGGGQQTGPSLLCMAEATTGCLSFPSASPGSPHRCDGQALRTVLGPQGSLERAAPPSPP